MPLCKHCGVELNEGAAICPLCRQPMREDAPTLVSAPPVDEAPVNHEHSWFWEFTTFMTLAAAVVVFGVDVAFGMRVGWSRIPLASLAYMWLFITAIRFLGRRPFLFITSIAVTSIGLLWFLAFCTGGDWFWALSLPLVTALALAAALTVLLSLLLRAGVQSILAIAMLMLGGFMFAVEALVTQFVTGEPSLRWSLVVFACILPLTGFLLVMHKRLKRKGFSFSRFFHA